MIALLVGLASLAVFGVAYGNGSSTSTPSPQGSISGVGGELTALGGPSSLGDTGYGGNRSGIWVTGMGSVVVEPDLAVLNLGVEARGRTVEEARGQAASAMDRIMDALQAHKIAETDIQTRHFSIQPEYVYKEIFEGESRYSKRELVGYIVNNTVRVKIRDLEDVGPTIDDAVQAGGDLTRIDGVSITVDETAPYTIQARELAIRDAIAKARQFATVAEVQVGPLVFIGETSALSPVARGVAFALEEAAPALAPTSISGGELKVQVTVQAVFAVQ